MIKPNIFMRLNAWQIFILIILPNFWTFNIYLTDVLRVFCFSIYIGYIYTIGLCMHSKLALAKPSTLYFKFSAILFCISFIAGIFINEDFLNQDYTKPNVILMILVAIYIFWSFLYICMFSARMLTSVIEGRLVLRSDSLKAFFGLWILPLGIWFIQPAVRQIVNQNQTVKN